MASIEEVLIEALDQIGALVLAEASDQTEVSEARIDLLIMALGALEVSIEDLEALITVLIAGLEALVEVSVGLIEALPEV